MWASGNSLFVFSLDSTSYYNLITSWWNKKEQIEEKEEIVSCTFDRYEIDNQIRKCLIVIYSNGFQIWDISDLNHVFEIYSTREFPGISMGRMVPNPTVNDEKEDKFYNSRPVFLFLQNNDDSNIPCKLTFISLKNSNTSFLQFRKETKILDIQCNSHAICIVRAICIKIIQN